MASSSVVVVVTARSALLSKLDHNVGSHEWLSIEVVNSILGVLGIFELDETKA
jgi:hypothetical protein